MDEYLSKPYTQNQLRRVLETCEGAPAVKPAGKPAEKAVETPAASGAVLDPRALDQIRALQQPGAPDLLGRIIGLYLENSRTLTEQIRAALAAGDATGLLQAAHALKSSSANVGATALADLAGQLEALGREARLDAARLLVNPMFQAHERVVGALQARQAVA